MDATILAIGCAETAQITISLATGPATPEITYRCERAIWFDRDLDGSWLVWATGPEGGDGEPTQVGAIAVRDSTVEDFLDHLSHLIAFPDRFAHGPRFDGEAGLEFRPNASRPGTSR